MLPERLEYGYLKKKGGILEKNVGRLWSTCSAMSKRNWEKTGNQSKGV
jgi:hypothetical protein